MRDKESRENRKAGLCSKGLHPWIEGRRQCKECRRTSSRGSARNYLLKSRFGITADEYATLLESQGGVCAICQNDSNFGRRLAVDHNHETNEVRGLLCGNCNTSLGGFKDSEKLLARAIEYLRGEYGRA